MNVDLAEWLAHQTVENYRIVSRIAEVIQEVDASTKLTICNGESCPRTTAGRHTYTWLDNKREPMPVSAPQYISLLQRWMKGKVHDPKAFPVDPGLLRREMSFWHQHLSEARKTCQMLGYRYLFSSVPNPTP